MGYAIIRFNRGSNNRRTGTTYETEEEAQEHCSREDTHQYDKAGHVVWFEGYTKT